MFVICSLRFIATPNHWQKRLKSVRNGEIGNEPNATSKVTVSFNGNVAAVAGPWILRASLVIEGASGPIKLTEPTTIQKLPKGIIP